MKVEPCHYFFTFEQHDDGQIACAFAPTFELIDDSPTVSIDYKRKTIELSPLYADVWPNAALAVRAAISDLNSPEYGYALRVFLSGTLYPGKVEDPARSQWWWLPWVLEGTVVQWDDMDIDPERLVKRLHRDAEAFFQTILRNPNQLDHDDHLSIRARQWQCVAESIAPWAALDLEGRTRLDATMGQVPPLSGNRPGPDTEQSFTHNLLLLEDPLCSQERERYAAHRREKLMEHVQQKKGRRENQRSRNEGVL